MEPKPYPSPCLLAAEATGILGYMEPKPYPSP